MPRTTSFQLSDELDSSIAERVERGEYRSANDVVRAALEQLFVTDQREAELHAALDRALGGGRAERGVWERLRERHAIR